MKKFFCLLALLPLFSCSNDFEEAEDTGIRPFLTRCIAAAYSVHNWMQEEGMCDEYECCWEFVPEALRQKYESGATLSVAEMESVITGLEHSPSFIDTLAEFDEFVELDYYREYGLDWFTNY